MTTQEDILSQLEEEGYSTSKRNLGYWRSLGLLPPLQREGQQYYWKEDVLERVKVLCRKKEILKTIELEGTQLIIERVEIKRINGIAVCVIRLDNGSFLIHKIRESVLDAITPK